MSALIFCIIHCKPVVLMRKSILEYEMMIIFWLKVVGTKEHGKFSSSGQNGGSLLGKQMQ